MIVLLLILSLLGSCIGKWSDTTRIFTNVGVATSIYIDPSTNITHFGYSTQPDPRFLDNYQICYKSMKPTGEFTNEICLNGDPRLYRCTITGAGNGKNLYLTAFGPRASFDGFCSEKGTEYCYDIYFTESTDAGLTWDKWHQVERDNMDDIIRRLGETTVYVQETGRLFIFYSIGSYEHVNGVAFVTRPKGSAVFSRESIITKQDPHYINAGVGAAYTYDKGTLVMHVIWEELWGKTWGEHDIVSYTESRDMGITWSKPRAIMENVTGALVVIPVAQLFSNPAIDPSYLLFTYTDRDKKMHLLDSHDNGKTFGHDKILTREGDKGHITSIAYVGTKTKNLAFVSHSNENYENELSFFVYDPATAELKELDEPFKGYEEIMSPWVAVLPDKEAKNFHVRLFSSYYSSYIVGGMMQTLNYPVA